MFLHLSLPLFPFIRVEVLPVTFALPHLLFFSTLLCLLSSSSSLPPLLSSPHLSLHSPPTSVLASLVSTCPAHVTLPLSSVVFHRPYFLRVQPTVICSSPVSLSSSTALPCLPLTPPFFACLLLLLLHMINPETVERQSAPPKNDVLLIAEALAASVNANRLLVPEPSVFNGDPLEYPD